MELTYEIQDGRALYNGRRLRDWVPAIVDALVAAFDPVKVILFGSVAAGTDGPDSDLDLLVVLDRAPLERRRDLMVELRRATRHLGAPMDLLVTDAASLAARGHVLGTTEYAPANHGTVVYERR